jgi:ferrous iron transport protein A
VLRDFLRNLRKAGYIVEFLSLSSGVYFMIPLTTPQPGQTGLVHQLRGGHRFVSRLAALGFTPGAPVTVTRNHGIGPLIVTVRGTQVALGRGEAGHVMVYAEEDGDAAGSQG